MVAVRFCPAASTSRLGHREKRCHKNRATKAVHHRLRTVDDVENTRLRPHRTCCTESERFTDAVNAWVGLDWQTVKRLPLFGKDSPGRGIDSRIFMEFFLVKRVVRFLAFSFGGEESGDPSPVRARPLRDRSLNSPSQRHPVMPNAGLCRIAPPSPL